MKIEIKYTVSDAPHLMEISLSDIQQMINSGNLSITHQTQKGTKTITFSGTKAERDALAQALMGP